MQPVKLLYRWLPLVVLITVSVLSWRAAQANDTDQAEVVPVEYAQELSTPVLSARRLPRTLQAPLAEQAVEPVVDEIATRATETSCFVVTLNGQRVNDERGSLVLIPASNQKLLTTWAALSTLDPETTFTTEVRFSNTLADGVLNGDLYLVGGGDPFLVTADWPTQFDDSAGRSFTLLETLADRVVATGLTQVTGTIFGDESLFDSVRFGPWDQRLIDQKQSGPLSALSVNQGYTQWPAIYPGVPGSRDAALDPPLNAATVFAGLLAERGVTVGAVATGVAPETALNVAGIESAPLLDIATHINSFSDNYGAEILLKHLGRAGSGVGSTEAGAAAVRTTLASDPSMPLTGIVINDGSGLAESDRISCDLVVAVLETATPGSPFASTLSVAGERGSLAKRFADLGLNGQVLAKTGTLATATALSGYVVSDDDPASYATFSIIINGELASTYESLEQEVVLLLADFPDAPDVTELDPLEPIDS